MSQTQQLTKFLLQYQNLELHHNALLRQLTWQICAWQQQRMQHIHSQLCTPPHHHAAKRFFFSHLYNFDMLSQLAQQLSLAVQQKIKLERWLPSEVLATLQTALQLAMLTLELDQQLAQQLIKQQLSVSDTNILSIYPALQQTNARHEQIQLLEKLVLKLHKFAHSYLLRSALRLGRNKIQQRGFTFLYQYIDDGFQIMRLHRESKTFLLKLLHQEQHFIDYLVNAKPTTLQLYYESNNSITV